jgi:hypothetical protein
MLTCDFCKTTLLQHDCALCPLCGGCLVTSVDHEWHSAAAPSVAVDQPIDREELSRLREKLGRLREELELARNDRAKFARKLGTPSPPRDRPRRPPITGEAWDKVKREGPAWCPKPYGSRGL